MISFPIFQQLQVAEYLLFPGTPPEKPGIDFEFQDGISLIAGVNGLGKTTLVNVMYRLLVGPWELPKDSGTSSFGGAAAEAIVGWPFRSRYFAQRVSDKASRAHATLRFLVGRTAFVVTRELATCRLKSASVNGQALSIDTREDAYQMALTKAIGLGRFVDVLTLIKYMTFFNEERRDILWDVQAQRQFFRILFVPLDDAVSWSTLEVEINKADSAARNFSASAVRLERELNRLEEEFRTNAGVGDELAAAQQLLDADLERHAEIEVEVDKLEQEIRQTRRDLERAKIFEDEALRELELLRYGALQRLFPNLEDTAQYVLTHLFAEGICLACEADAPTERRRFERALETGDCPVCGAKPEEQKREENDKVTPPAALEKKRLQRARRAVSNARTQRDALTTMERAQDARLRAALQSMATVSTAIADQTRANEALRARLPPEPEELEQRRRAVAILRQDEEKAKRERRAKERLYEDLLKSAQAAIQRATKLVASHFRLRIGFPGG